MIEIYDIKTICNCQSRILWIGEDTEGNIAAIGKYICYFNINNQIVTKRQPIKGEPVPLLISGELAYIRFNKHQYQLYLNNKQLTLPLTKDDEIYTAIFNTEQQMLYILSKMQIISINTTNLLINKLANQYILETGEPQYEQISTKENLLVAYRYGITIWQESKQIATYNSNPYNHVVILSDNDIAAIDDTNSLIHIYNLSTEKRLQHTCPNNIYYSYLIGKDLVIVWKEEEDIYGEVINLISGNNTHKVLLSNHPTTFEPIDQNLLAIGLLNGNILIWEIYTGKTKIITIPNPYKITELYWSSNNHLLLIGCGDGQVKTCTLQ